MCCYFPTIGTILYYKPGVLIGGNVNHNCNMSRSMGYYLEPIIMLAPFMMKPLTITLKGITNGPCDPSVCAVVDTYYCYCTLLVTGRLLQDVCVTKIEGIHT